METTKTERRTTTLGSMYKEQNVANKIINQVQKTCNNASYNNKDYFSDYFDKTDSTLSYYYYNFLNSFSDFLPSFEYVYNIESLSKDDLISVGYGISVHKGLLIESFHMISNKKERLDRISLNDYTVSLLGSGCMYEDQSRGVLDPEVHPIFKKERIKLFQKYLSEYSNYKNSIKVKRIHK